MVSRYHEAAESGRITSASCYWGLGMAGREETGHLSPALFIPSSYSTLVFNDRHNNIMGYHAIDTQGNFSYASAFNKASSYHL